jgi:predicted permease
MWSFGFVAIALFSLVVAADGSGARGTELARAALGITLVFFVLWLLWGRYGRDRDRDRRSDQ